MHKVILYDKEARQKVKDGIDKVVDVVKVTLGALGRNVLIKRSYISTQGHGLQHLPLISTKDGVTVVRSLTLTDHLENMGADLVKEAAEKTMYQAGDGTTTTCILVQAIVEQGLKLVDQGVNPMELKKGIDKAVEYVVAELKKMSVAVGDDIEKIRQIATVSANNDKEIGDLIAEAFKKIGNDGIIDIEEAKGTVTEIKTTDGVKIDRGWISPYFVNNQSKNECELINPYILLYDKKLTQMKPLENILNQVIGEGRSILIICDDADGEALAALAMNTAQGRIKACIVRSPGFGDSKREAMEDLAILTGGEYVSDEKGKGLAALKLTNLGQAAKVIVGKDETVIVSGESKKEELENLLNDLKMNLVKADGMEKEAIEKRIAKLTGGVAVLYVGAATEVEMKEKKDRVDDAIRATKAAIAEGYISGGGTAFLLLSLHEIVYVADKNKPFQEGDSLLLNALVYPLQQICSNSGVDFETVKKDIFNAWGEKRDNYTFPEGSEDYNKEKCNIGYNAKTGKIENLIDSGIIDPVKVLRCSLENAASAAGILITSSALICDNI